MKKSHIINEIIGITSRKKMNVARSVAK